MKKSIIYLSVICVLLIILAIIVLQKPGEKSVSEVSEGNVFQLDSASVDKIEIKTSSLAIKFEKRGQEWFITKPIEYRANQTNVNQVIHYVKIMENKGEVSNKPEKHSIFRVDEKGTEIVLYEKGDPKTAFILGKMADRYNSYFIRKKNSNEVVLAEGIYSHIFDRSLKDWRDKEIFSTSKELIKSIQFKYGNISFKLELRDTAWYIGKDLADKNTVDRILTSLATFTADDFVDSTISPKVTATIDVNGNQLRFAYNNALKKYYVQTSKSAQWYIVEEWRAKEILKQKNDIIKR